ncbi:subclass B3 metallo-beta-lactamase [Herbaspirillum sp. SJZ107]|uniref:subclass B3 metallo-beta-lactamase n=1 Tax=Herbaspirillum sp. SJZ107 TaxID=2572881 RepID=UPI001151ED12|nr:subclass B3 metallo-beta-lactamase [Herbaspirillum sp. SJZ107]TQK07455.1 metallo-beta-lactamase class B [Herbaspirillum sp. SJZ107]
MKTTLRHLLAAALCASALTAPVLAADWNGPQEPFALFGNTYYVGTAGLSSVLITSKAGHILIDGATPQAAAQIAQHIRQLGFRVEDIRYILTSHEHFDHAGGLAELQKLSGATVLTSPEALKVLRTGQADKGDPQYTGPDGDLPPMTPVAKLRAVRDGEVVTLGPLAVTARFTPGHTRGGTSWTWRASEGGKTVDIVYADSLNAVAADGKRFDGNPGYPTARADIERSMATVEGLKCDVLVSAHPEFSGLWERKAKQPQMGNTAFIDGNACKAYVATARVRLQKRLETDAKMATAR